MANEQVNRQAGATVSTGADRAQLRFERFEKLSDPALSHAMLAALEGLEAEKPLLGRANLLRRMGDIDGTRAAFRELAAPGRSDWPTRPHAWSAIPAGHAFAGCAIAPLVCIDDFLPEERMHALYRHACDRADEFSGRISTAATLGKSAGGQTLLNRDLGAERDHFAGFIDTHLPALRECLGLPPFDVAHIELNLLNTTGGGFLDVHSDHPGPTRPEGRAITCLYYFAGPLARFGGGDLLLLDSAPQAEKFSGTWFTRITPRPNRFIAFPSWFYHAVSPVTGTNGEFTRGRMAVGCQVRKAEGTMDAWWEKAIGSGAGA